MRSKLYLGGMALLIVALLFVPLDALLAQPNYTNFTSVGVEQDLTVGDDVIVGDTVSISGDVTLGSDVTLTPATVIDVEMNATISPAGAYQPLESAGTVNTASITAGAAGDVLILVNTVDTSIVLTDTGTLMLVDDRTLGQYDTLTLLSDGTNWLEISFTDN